MPVEVGGSMLGAFFNQSPPYLFVYFYFFFNLFETGFLTEPGVY